MSDTLPRAIEAELAEHQRQIDQWHAYERRAAEARDYLGAHEARAAAERWQRSRERLAVTLRSISGGGSAETSRGCGHAASSGAAGANVAPETANQSESLAGGAL